MASRVLRPGDQIHRLIVLEELGRGARGVVYKAHDGRLDRNVALKLLHTDARAQPNQDAAADKRLVKEAQAMAQIAHNNVVAVYDVGTVELGGAISVFIEMEYVRGGSLREQMDRWQAEPSAPGGPRLAAILDAFVQAGEGLAAAHRERLVHRDFKPANVLLSEQGRVAVTDFGLVRRSASADDITAQHDDGPAKLAALDVMLTQTGTVVGTPAYMAPEQFAGQDCDARADQFAFCVALFEALYGHRPFRDGSFAELALSVATEAPRPPPSGVPTAPAHVHRAVLRGLNKDPDARFMSMSELLTALRRDPAVGRRRALSGLGGIAGVGAVGYAVTQWFQPGVLALTVSSASGPLQDVTLQIDGQPHSVQSAADGIGLSAELSAGRHRVQVRAADHELRTADIEIARGDTLRLPVSLKHEQALVDIEVHPRGAQLSLDGDSFGSTLNALSMDTGAHALALRVSGRHEATLRFDLVAGERKALSAYAARGVIFERRGAGLALGEGPAGDVDGDGLGDIWVSDYTTLTLYAPHRDRRLWSTSVSEDSDAFSVRAVDVDADGVQEFAVLSVYQGRAQLRLLDGRDASVRWTAEVVDATRRRARPLVPPVLVEHDGRLEFAVTSMEPGVVMFVDAQTGRRRPSTLPIGGVGFGLVSGHDPDGSWVAVAADGEVIGFDVATEAVLWRHRSPTLGKALWQRWAKTKRLVRRGRDRADSWLVVGALDEHTGQDVAFVTPDADDFGELVVHSGRSEAGRVFPIGANVWSLRVGEDINGDGVSELEADTESGKSAMIDALTGQTLDRRRPGERWTQWPCGGAAAAIGHDSEGNYLRRPRQTRKTRLPWNHAIVDLRCADWDGDGQAEAVVATEGHGLRALAPDGELGAVALDGAAQVVVPLGDTNGDARPDFLVRANGPQVVLGSRVRWARVFAAQLRAPPVIADFNGDGALDVAVFNGQQDASFLQIVNATDGNDRAKIEAGGFALNAPVVVDGVWPGTKDLISTSHHLRIMRVVGHDYAVHPLPIGDDTLEAYAGIGATADGRQLWVVSYDEAPHLRGLAPPTGQWTPGSGRPGTQTWETVAAFSATSGGWSRPVLGQLDNDDADEVIAAVDGNRLVVLDTSTGDCAWSRSTSGGRLSDGVTLFDLDSDGRFEVLVPLSPDAPQGAKDCQGDGPGDAGETDAADLVAVDGATGVVRWRLAQAAQGWCRPKIATVDAHPLLVGCSGVRGLFGVRPGDDTPRWSHPPAPTDPKVSSPIAVGDLNGDGRPEAVVGMSDGQLRVHDAATGTLQWTWTPPNPVAQRSAPVVFDIDGDGAAEILLATGSGYVFALDGSFVMRGPDPTQAR